MLCTFLVCQAPRAKKMQVSANRYTAAGTVTRMNLQKALCDEHTALIRLGTNAGLELRTTEEGWLFLDNLKAVIHGN
jgi:hypothetical protein